ncbi:MAG: hypothetical protein HOA00_14175, partial [Rhodospirillaceae bacterium]|nr:hypothetical protein [Rhodospirillaceae bacterium]
QKFLDQAEEIGFTIHTLTPAQRDSWIQASAPVTDQIIEGIGGKAAEIYEAIQEAKRTFNAGR